MNKQHTPGPWTIGKVSHKKQRVDIDSLHADPSVGHQSWRGLARAYGCNDMQAEGTAAMLANARLIAAAPELLELLQELCECPQWVDEATIPKAGIDAAPQQVVINMSVGLVRLRNARAAIAKATGETT